MTTNPTLGRRPSARSRRSDGARDTTAAPPPTSPSRLAWLLLLPSAGLTVLLVNLLSEPLGRLMIRRAEYQFFPAVEPLVPVPVEQAGYVVAVLCVGAFALALVALAHRQPRLPGALTRALALLAQGVALAYAIWLWHRQHNPTATEPLRAIGFDRRVYFDAASVAIAAAVTGGLVLGLTLSGRARLAAIGRRLSAWPHMRRACLGTAALLTAIWLLPSIFTDANIGLASIGVTHHVRYTFNEPMAILNGRSPLVDYAGYASLWPYVFAGVMSVLGTSIGVFTTFATLLTASALLAVYGVLHRVTRRPLLALALYLPFLATSLFFVYGETVERYTFGNYYAEFPLRYAAPFWLMWLAVRRIEGRAPSQRLLFVLAGLATINNVEFGFPALVATALALVVASPPKRARELLPLAGAIAFGLVVALALVSLVTFLRAGTYPHFGVFLQYTEVFGIAGFGRIPVGTAGFPVLMALTAVAAVVTAAVRFARRAENCLLTAMLAYSGVFALGAAQYYVNRPNPETLIGLFSMWALPLMLLVVATVEGVARRRVRLPTLPELAVLFAFGLTVTSLSQVPAPWSQIERLGASAPEQTMKLDAVRRFVEARTEPGEVVTLFLALGHRIAYDAGVVNTEVSAGFDLMPTIEQMNASLRAMHDEGGRKVFVGEFVWNEVPAVLERAGYVRGATDPITDFTEWVAPPGGADDVTLPR